MHHQLSFPLVTSNVKHSALLLPKFLLSSSQPFLSSIHPFSYSGKWPVLPMVRVWAIIPSYTLGLGEGKGVGWGFSSVVKALGLILSSGGRREGKKLSCGGLNFRKCPPQADVCECLVTREIEKY